MMDASAASRFLFPAVLFAGLASARGLRAGAPSWKEETVLVSPQGDRTVVRPLEGDGVLFRDADPKRAIEWALAEARTTVVLAGKYVVSDSIVIPRDRVTLILDRGAEISLNPETEHKTDIGFRSRRTPGYWKLVPLIYNRGHDAVRVILLGKLVHSVWQNGGHGKQTFPIVFDGRNDRRTCGIEGGYLLVAGSTAQSCVLLDARGVEVPLLALEAGLDGVLTLEGCEDCRLGMLVNLASEPDGVTGETVDLNARNRGIAVERLVGQRPYEIIDCNESHATVGEVVSVGAPRKLLTSTSGSGPRWTSRPRTGSVSLRVKKKTILEDAAAASLRKEVPTLPDALPRFTVKAVVEVTLEDGSKKVYAKAVEIDVRGEGAARGRRP